MGMSAHHAQINHNFAMRHDAQQISHVCLPDQLLVLCCFNKTAATSGVQSKCATQNNHESNL
jgi:hypothetical protein